MSRQNHAEWEIATRAIHVGQEPDAETAATVPPVHFTSTYTQASPGRHKGFEYSRSGLIGVFTEDAATTLVSLGDFKTFQLWRALAEVLVVGNSVFIAVFCWISALRKLVRAKGARTAVRTNTDDFLPSLTARAQAAFSSVAVTTVIALDVLGAHSR